MQDILPRIEKVLVLTTPIVKIFLGRDAISLSRELGVSSKHGSVQEDKEI